MVAWSFLHANACKLTEESRSSKIEGFYAGCTADLCIAVLPIPQSSPAPTPPARTPQAPLAATPLRQLALFASTSAYAVNQLKRPLRYSEEHQDGLEDANEGVKIYPVHSIMVIALTWNSQPRNPSTTHFFRSLKTFCKAKVR